MRPISRTLLATIFALSAASISSSATAQEDKVVAKIGTHSISSTDLDQAVQRLGQQFANVPEDQRRARVLDALIDFTVLANEAEKAGFDKEDDVKRTLAYLRLQALHNAYFRKQIEVTVTEEAMKERYAKELATQEPVKEVKARHILVKTSAEAEAIIKQLQDGADFIELAKEKSTGPSGASGGDLGYFGQGRMVPQFEAAAFKMKPGEVSKEPLKTEFGFHVLKVEDFRDVAPPTYQASKAKIQNQMLSEAYAEAVATARKSQNVELIDKSLALPEQP